MEWNPDQQHHAGLKMCQETPPRVNFSTGFFFSPLKKKTDGMQKHPHRPMHNEVFFFYILCYFK